MDKAVEPVERIFGLFFISSDPKQNRMRGTGWLFGTAAAVKPAFHGYHEAEGHSSICLWAGPAGPRFD